MRKSPMKHGCAQSVVPVVALLAFAFAAQAVWAESAKAGSWSAIEIPAPSLKGNLLTTPDTRAIAVLVPAGYTEHSQTRYPVVYFLPGYSTPHFWLYKSVLGGLSANDLILVVPDGTNRLGGAFYHNSPVAGNWEDYIVKDLVGYVDAHFRTVATPAGRGISGMSMGGYGALEIALKHPDVFSAVFALSPGIFDQSEESPAGREAGLREAFPQWKAEEPGFLTAYGTAFAPDPEGKLPNARIPAFDGTAADAAVVALWLDGFGNFDRKLDAYLAREDRLSAIHLEWGAADEYKWIPKGCACFTRLLTARGIPFEAVTFPGGHVDRVRARVIASLVPFFSANLRLDKELRP
jgi:S-formylglutathione hydrolase FrmB